MKLLRLACLALGHNVDAITVACHMCGQQLLHPITVADLILGDQP